MSNGGGQVDDSVGYESKSKTHRWGEENEERDANDAVRGEDPVLNFNPPVGGNQISRGNTVHDTVEMEGYPRSRDEQHTVYENNHNLEADHTVSHETLTRSGSNSVLTNITEKNDHNAREDDTASNSRTVVPDGTSIESAKALERTDSVDFISNPHLGHHPGPNSTSAFTYASEVTHTTDFVPSSNDKESGLADSRDQDVSATPIHGEDAKQLGSLALALLITGICLAVYLISLDRTIVATVRKLRIDRLKQCADTSLFKAVPRITDQFHSYNDVGWYGSAYLVTACALQPTYGRIYGLFDIKWSFLSSMVIFEVGSLICAVTPSSVVLIIGRAIAGWGSAGVLTGSFIAVAHSVPLQQRPIYTGIVGIMYVFLEHYYYQLNYTKGDADDLLLSCSGSDLELSLVLCSVVFSQTVLRGDGAFTSICRSEVSPSWCSCSSSIPRQCQLHAVRCRRRS